MPPLTAACLPSLLSFVFSPPLQEMSRGASLSGDVLASSRKLFKPRHPSRRDSQPAGAAAAPAAWAASAEATATTAPLAPSGKTADSRIPSSCSRSRGRRTTSSHGNGASATNGSSDSRSRSCSQERRRSEHDDATSDGDVCHASEFRPAAVGRGTVGGSGSGSRGNDWAERVSAASGHSLPPPLVANLSLLTPVAVVPPLSPSHRVSLPVTGAAVAAAVAAAQDTAAAEAEAEAAARRASVSVAGGGGRARRGGGALFAAGSVGGSSSDIGESVASDVGRVALSPLQSQASKELSGFGGAGKGEEAAQEVGSGEEREEERDAVGTVGRRTQYPLWDVVRLPAVGERFDCLDYFVSSQVREPT